MIKFSICILTIFLAISIAAFSQGKQANNWYFGYHAGLDFNTGSPPSVLSNGMTFSNMPRFNGTASISDNNGHLLFYSDGRTIWNKNHTVMLNGSDMGFWSTQGAMIVPDPGNSNLYYFFNFLYNGIALQSTFSIL